MATRTQQDYADMVNPYVRAEEEAEERGFRRGIGAGVFGTILVLAFAAALILYRVEAKGAESRSAWLSVETWRPISASQVGARITVCHTNPKPIGLPWLCYATR